MDAFPIKQHDTQPSISAVLKDDDTAIDLTGATVVFEMRKRVSRCPDVALPAVKVLAAAVNLDTGVPTRGKVRYDWAAGDTDEAGTFDAVFRVTTSGLVKTYPTVGFIPVTIHPNLP